MKKSLIIILASTLFVLNFGACSKSNTKQIYQLKSESDSVAYVIGMNIGCNLFEMDSTINVEAVCAAIKEYYTHSERFDHEEARRIYLHRLHVSMPEEMLAYENRRLEEITTKDRSYARSKSGLTYSVESVGDEEFTPRNNNDTVTLRIMGRTMDGEIFYSSFERGDTLRIAFGDLNEGVKESLKLIGKGGHINAYLPAEIGYGADGNDSLGIKPNTTLYYEIDLLDMERPNRRNLRVNRRTTLDF